MNELIWLLAVSVSAFQLIDGWLTLRIIERGGVELNPLMAWLFKMFGDAPVLYAAKLAVIWFVLSGAFLGWFESEGGVVLLAMLTVFYGWVVAYNYEQYQR